MTYETIAMGAASHCEGAQTCGCSDPDCKLNGCLELRARKDAVCDAAEVEFFAELRRRRIKL